MPISSSSGTTDIILGTIPLNASAEMLYDALDEELSWIRNARTRSMPEETQWHRAIQNTTQYLFGWGLGREKEILPLILEMLNSRLDGYTFILNRLGYDIANDTFLRSIKQLSQRDYEKLLLAVNHYTKTIFLLNVLSVGMELDIEEGDERHAVAYWFFVYGCEQAMFMEEKFVALKGHFPEHHKFAAFAALEAMIDVRLKRFGSIFTALKEDPQGILREAIAVTAVEGGLDLYRFRDAVANEIRSGSPTNEVSLNSLQEQGFDISAEDTAPTFIDDDYFADILGCSGLSPQEREVIEALSTSCDSNIDVAELLNIPANQVAQAKSRAFRKIRNASEKK